MIAISKDTYSCTYGGNNMEKRLYRNTSDQMLAGVCSGIGEYFNIDPTLIRLGWVVFSLAGGSGLLAYIIAAIIIPEKPHNL